MLIILFYARLRQLFKKAHNVEGQRIFTSADETGLLCNDENTMALICFLVKLNYLRLV